MTPDASYPEAPFDTPADTLTVDDRRERMLGYIRSKDFVRVQELARAFSVSDVTIRSDLDMLARHDSVRRVHGGVIATRTSRRETAFEERTDSFAAEKRQVAEAAVRMLRSGDSAILDAGTTTMAIAQVLAERDDLRELTIFTPGLNVALALERAIPRLHVIVTGGSLRPQQHSLVEPYNTLILRQVRASIAFIGCNGFDPQLGIMASSMPDAVLKQALIAAARRIVVVTDASKFTQSALVSFCRFDEVDTILTAGSVDADALAIVREAGGRVEVVNGQ